MANSVDPENPKFSRRTFIGGLALGGSALACASLAATQARAANKLPQSAVKYQPSPKGKQRCDTCTLWQTPASCQLVEGTISPSGWCTLYRQKS
jgi:hypothetical protein